MEEEILGDFNLEETLEDQDQEIFTRDLVAEEEVKDLILGLTLEVEDLELCNMEEDIILRHQQ